MIILAASLLLFLVESLFCYLRKTGLDFFRNANKILFPSCMVLIGALHIRGIIDIDHFYIWNDSFEKIGIKNQISHSFILVPLLILFLTFFQILKKEPEDKSFLTTLFFVFVTVSMGSYNINFIFFVFIMYEIFSIEFGERFLSNSDILIKSKIRKLSNLKSLRKEIAILSLVIYPFIFKDGGIFFKIFFFLLVALSILDILSMALDQESSIKDQILDIIVIFPLRMTVLVYYASFEYIEGIFLNLGKIILLLFFLFSFCYSFMSNFSSRSVILVCRALFLGIVFSGFNLYYMELYFILGLLLIHDLDMICEGKSKEWPLIGLALIILLSLFDGWLNLTRVLIVLFDGDFFSKILTFFFVFFLTMFPIRWARLLKKTNFVIKVSQKEIYYIIFLITGIFFAATHSLGWHQVEVSWSSRTALSFYFIIMFLLFYIAKSPQVKLRSGMNLVWISYRKPQVYRKDNVIEFKTLESLSYFFVNILFATVSFFWKIIANLWFISSEICEYAEIKKYRRWAAYFLITFLLFWIKVF